MFLDIHKFWKHLPQFAFFENARYPDVIKNSGSAPTTFQML